MNTPQKILDIAQRMEKQAEQEENQGRYDVEAMLRGYVCELRLATVPKKKVVTVEEVADIVDACEKSLKETNDELKGSGSGNS